MLAKRRDSNKAAESTNTPDAGEKTPLKPRANEPSGAKKEAPPEISPTTIEGSFSARIELSLHRSPECERRPLVERFGIQVHGKGKVSLIIPAATSIIRALIEIDEGAFQAHGRRAIDPGRLALWANDPGFSAVAPYDALIGVDGCVKSSTGKTRAQQEARGWNNIEETALAAAHAGYFLKTGKDLFGGNICRFRSGALFFFPGGLDHRASLEERGFEDICSAARIDPQR